MRKRLLIILSILFGFVHSSHAQTLTVFTPSNTTTTDFDTKGISPNGTYLIGSRYFVSSRTGTFSITYFILNWQNYSTVTNITSDHYYPATSKERSICDVNNIGNACGSVMDDDSNVGAGYCVPAVKNGKKTTIKHVYKKGAIAKYINVNNSIVGYNSGTEPYLATATGGVISLPTPASVLDSIQSGFYLIPLYISDDESTIIGTLQYNNRYIPVKWIYGQNGYECYAFAEKWIEPVLHEYNYEYSTSYKSFNITYVSPNGEWLSGLLTSNENKSYTARYNMTLDSFDILEDKTFSGGPIADNGLMVGKDSKNGHYYWPADADTIFTFEEVFPIVKEIGGMTPVDISADGKTIIGDYGYSIVVLSDAVADIPSNIRNINNNKECKTEIFTLNGMRIEKITSPGIYIKNGKKIIVR